ncbi:phytanoyl-CoA dioxygenase family protein [Aspergillus clavatus NRRL 1]|uniref:Phytanoyl-CoA dioxygenase family protein n=1 Tax=Aspergillus clavatus (strain ATCC 1007 / CBS 513.65 / DSM 816 / NCTC 3887 / NRRL 1 / QM 1276 / 107) TaxID=344612 RepID=A1C622_ASPCL|nr:phytanoyl-CoA dioxygenase family protein [Aspergillus clavatus NRRL 1]EAW13843.1 phytanoyl-CoA dioxygenase family protein [Aspergillus clavatus NRRL 1]
MTGHSSTPNRLFEPSSLDLEEFKRICSQTTDQGRYPLASTIEKNIPLYDAATFDPLDTALTPRLQDEWHHALSCGPGIIVLKNMYHRPRYTQTLTATTATFQHIIAHERTLSTKGDHFATGGRNDRIWNSFSKHALHDPSSFIDYYANPWLRLAAEAWLGPAYRVTAQVNVVKPGGAAQDPHRDYHLGFQGGEACARFPRTLHVASQYLTLQGAVAHSTMPASSGPTRFLPFSQTFAPGYLAWRGEPFRDFFRDSYVTLPLGEGDGVFFNPAVFHAAGANEMSASASACADADSEDGEGAFHRKANLLQISCAFGKAMESVDTVPIVERCWGQMLARYQGTGLDAEMEALVMAVAEGYPFPTNLDRRPPAPSGMAPESEQEIVLRGLREGWSTERVVGELRRMGSDSAA